MEAAHVRLNDRTAHLNDAPPMSSRSIRASQRPSSSRRSSPGRQRGTQLDIFALRPTTDVPFHPELARVKAPVHFVPRRGRCRRAGRSSARRLRICPDSHSAGLKLLPELTEYPADDVHQAVWIALELHRRGITHLHGHFGSLAGQTAELAALLAGVTFSVTTHAKDLFHDSVDPDRLRLLLRRAHHTVTISSYNLEHLARLAPESADRVHLVYNGLELDRFPYRAPRRIDRRTPLQIVGVGRLVEKKGFADPSPPPAVCGTRRSPSRCGSPETATSARLSPPRSPRRVSVTSSPSWAR